MAFLQTARTWAARIKQDTLTLWFAYRHPKTPWYVKLLCLLVVGYAFSPIDLIPDFIPVLGYVDDVLLLPVLIRLSVRLLPSEVIQDCRQSAADWQAQRKLKPRSYTGAMTILFIWSLLIYTITQWVTMR